MAERTHAALNDISVVDKFRVKAVSRAQGVHFVFQAHGALGPNRPAEFVCHMYDSASLEHSAYIQTDTVSTDSFGAIRTCASGKTLDELVHNLDWAHKPSELAQLKALLSTRLLTNCKELVGDQVFRVRTPEEEVRFRSTISRHGERELEAQTKEATEAALSAIAEAHAQALLRIRCGLKPALAASSQTKVYG